MICEEGHDSILKSKSMKTGGYGYCLTCRQYKKLIPVTTGDQDILRNLKNGLYEDLIQMEKSDEGN